MNLIINRMRDVCAGCFFALVAISVGMVFAAESLHVHTGMLAIPVSSVLVFVLVLMFALVLMCLR